jgi:hypothetical protein
MYVSMFQEQFELIQDEKFRDFAVEAVGGVPEDSYTSGDISEIKSTVKYCREICAVLDVDDIVIDMFTVAGLIYLTGKYDYDNGSNTYDIPNPFHMLQARAILSRLQSIIGREQYNNIMLLIESQGGMASPIPQVEPRIEDPVFSWILPIAIHLARTDSGK